MPSADFGSELDFDPVLPFFVLYDNAARFLRLSDDEIARHHAM